MATTCAARVACSHVGRGGSRFITAQKRNPCPARGAEQPPSPVAGPPSVRFVASSGHSAATGDGLLVGQSGHWRHTAWTAGMNWLPDLSIERIPGQIWFRPRPGNAGRGSSPLPAGGQRRFVGWPLVLACLPTRDVSAMPVRLAGQVTRKSALVSAGAPLRAANCTAAATPLPSAS